jgi:hypothetical protein
MKVAMHKKLSTQKSVIRLTGFTFQILLSAFSKTTVTSAACMDQRNIEFPDASAGLKPRIKRSSGSIRGNKDIQKKQTLGFRRVSGALHHRKRRVFRESWVARRQFAEIERRAAVGLNPARVPAALA